MLLLLEQFLLRIISKFRVNPGLHLDNHLSKICYRNLKKYSIKLLQVLPP